jgi:hypothetical protein
VQSSFHPFSGQQAFSGKGARYPENMRRLPRTYWLCLHVYSSPCDRQKWVKSMNFAQGFATSELVQELDSEIEIAHKKKSVN